MIKFGKPKPAKSPAKPALENGDTCDGAVLEKGDTILLSSQTNRKINGHYTAKFDRNAYQREYMRKRRAAKKEIQ